MFQKQNFEEVHIWKAEISRIISITTEFGDFLSEEERIKASQFHDTKDETAYRVSHILLRVILASYLACHPSEIKYERGPYGKPRLCGQKPGEGICFNASHSHDIACVAVATNIEIGVDVEKIRPIQDLENIITQNFSVDEQKYLFSLPSNTLTKGFITCWTLKEAFVKAIGKGLSYPLNEFSVINRKMGIPIGGRVIVPEDANAKWFQLPLNFDPGYCSAIVLKDYYPSCRVLDFTKEIDLIIWE